MSNLNQRFLRLDARSSSNSRRLMPENVQSSLRRWALCAVLASSTLMIFGCATTHATLDFAAPSTATAGTPFTVTVTVLYGGKPDTVINSHIHFTSSDPAAVLPPDYYFTPADAGSHTWTSGFILMTPGSQILSGDIYDATGINGRANIIVSP